MVRAAKERVIIGLHIMNLFVASLFPWFHFAFGVTLFVCLSNVYELENWTGNCIYLVASLPMILIYVYLL